MCNWHGFRLKNDKNVILGTNNITTLYVYIYQLTNAPNSTNTHFPHLVATQLQKREVIFEMMFSLPSASSLLKVPIVIVISIPNVNVDGIRAENWCSCYSCHETTICLIRDCAAVGKTTSKFPFVTYWNSPCNGVVKALFFALKIVVAD